MPFAYEVELCYDGTLPSAEQLRPPHNTAPDGVTVQQWVQLYIKKIQKGWSRLSEEDKLQDVKWEEDLARITDRFAVSDVVKADGMD